MLRAGRCEGTTLYTDVQGKAFVICVTANGRLQQESFEFQTHLGYIGKLPATNITNKV